MKRRRSSAEDSAVLEHRLDTGAEMNLKNVLCLIDVRKCYALADGVSFDVLKDVTLEINAGETLAVVGPSGSGKSTLLNIMGMLDAPSNGRVLFDGEDVSIKTARELALLRKRKIGFIFQRHHLLPQCTVLENVLIPAIGSKDMDAAEQRALILLERVGLKGRMHQRPGKLSGGECQRAAVARALINNPRVVLADEPTGSLDRAGADSLAELLMDLNREQKATLVCVTHSERLAGKMSRVLALVDGTIVPAS